jgi:hypothetical protein
VIPDVVAPTEPKVLVESNKDKFLNKQNKLKKLHMSVDHDAQ